MSVVWSCQGGGSGGRGAGGGTWGRNAIPMFGARFGSVGRVNNKCFGSGVGRFHANFRAGLK